jgi:hypothetical protein
MLTGCSREEQAAKRAYDEVSQGMSVADLVRIAESVSPASDDWVVTISRCDDPIAQYLFYPNDAGSYRLELRGKERPWDNSTSRLILNRNELIAPTRNGDCRSASIHFDSWVVVARLDSRGSVVSVSAPWHSD